MNQESVVILDLDHLFVHIVVPVLYRLVGFPFPCEMLL